MAEYLLFNESAGGGGHGIKGRVVTAYLVVPRTATAANPKVVTLGFKPKAIFGYYYASATPGGIDTSMAITYTETVGKVYGNNTNIQWLKITDDGIQITSATSADRWIRIIAFDEEPDMFVSPDIDDSI